MFAATKTAYYLWLQLRQKQCVHLFLNDEYHSKHYQQLSFK